MVICGVEAYFPLACVNLKKFRFSCGCSCADGDKDAGKAA